MGKISAKWAILAFLVLFVGAVAATDLTNPFPTGRRGSYDYTGTARDRVKLWALEVEGMLESVTIYDGNDITFTNEQKISGLVNGRFEFSEATEMLALIPGTNKWELGTDSGAVTLDFNDVDALEDIESVTGDNGQKIDFAINDRVEIGENSEKLAVIFGNNIVELGTDSGVTTVDCNGLILTHYDTVVTADTDGKNLAATESGDVQLNTGAASGGVWNLPEASGVIGMRFTFAVITAQNMDINPDGGDQILGLTNAAGDAIRNATAGGTITLLATDAANWVVLGSYGTWSDVN